MTKMLLVVMLMVLVIFSSTGEIYKVYLDREFGFWAVRDVTNVSNHIDYKDRVIHINTGDTVIWENADVYDDRVTIVSDNLLWGQQGITMPFGRQHRLTFNSSGTFRFHIVENSRTTLNETATTEYYYEDQDTGEELSFNITTSGPTTKYFPFHAQTVIVTGPEIGGGTHPNYSIPMGAGNVTMVPDINTTLNSDNWKMFVKAVKEGNVTPYQEKVAKIKATPTVIQADTYMESYQEFTLYETLKRWFIIINGD